MRELINYKNMQSQTTLKSLLFLALMQFFILSAKAQDCELTLERAQKLYDNGIIEDIPKMLIPCIEQGFTPEDRLRAYKLLILSYLFDQNIGEADKSMLNFLKDYPEYELQKTDPAEFSQLFNTYRVSRIFSIGFSLGGNLTFPLLIKSYATNNQNLTGTYQNSGMGYEGGFKLNFYLASHLGLNFEGYYFVNSYAYSLSQPGEQQIHSKEIQTKLEFPLTISYHFGKNKLLPYISIGGSVDYLISARQNQDLFIISQNTHVSGNNINITSRRQQYNYNGIIGCGVKYKITRGFIFFDARWKQNILNQVVSSKRFNTTESFIYQNPDDNFYLNNLVFSAGYMHSFFKAKKKNSK
jgi:hypothetical protein